MEVSDQLQDPTALSPGEYTLVPIRQEAAWVSEPVWTLWWREKSHNWPSGESNLGRTARSL